MLLKDSSAVVCFCWIVIILTLSFECLIISHISQVNNGERLKVGNIRTLHRNQHLIVTFSICLISLSISIHGVKMGPTLHENPTCCQIVKGRTSSNTWCYADCERDELIKEAVHRLHNLTEIPYQHSEYMQLLHYEQDQYYRVHHDYVS